MSAVAWHPFSRSPRRAGCTQVGSVRGQSTLRVSAPPCGCAPSPPLWRSVASCFVRWRQRRCRSATGPRLPRNRLRRAVATFRLPGKRATMTTVQERLENAGRQSRMMKSHVGNAGSTTTGPGWSCSKVLHRRKEKRNPWLSPGRQSVTLTIPVPPVSTVRWMPTLNCDFAARRGVR